MVAGVMASGNGTVNRESRILSPEENRQVLMLLGPRCESLATSVVQLFMTEAPLHDTYIKRDTGVLCLVKDHLKRSYFLRMYCYVRKTMLWEHEVYNNMDYVQVKPFLHSFEGQDGIVALNFASEEDARVMHGVLLQKLDRKRHRNERKSRGATSTLYRNSMESPVITNQPPPAMNGTRPPVYQQQPYKPQHVAPTQNFQPYGGKKDKASGKKTLTKADIGLPSDFRHVSHVGWDPNKGFDVNVDDPQLKHFFVKAGVSDRQLQDPQTREFIYDFINQHGGLDAVKGDESPPPPPPSLFSPPAVPTRAPPPPSGRHAPPPPPSRLPPPPVPHAAPPPPPPPSRTMLPPPPPSQHSASVGGPAPPPPPPPPPLVFDGGPPAPPEYPAPPRDNSNHHQAAPPVQDSHSALMDAIKSGKQLKAPTPSEPKRPGPVPDSRDDLLGQIRKGATLKPVQHVPKPESTSAPADGLAGALARALAERNRANHSDSDASSSDDEDDDEWED